MFRHSPIYEADQTYCSGRRSPRGILPGRQRHACGRDRHADPAQRGHLLPQHQQRDQFGHRRHQEEEGRDARSVPTPDHRQEQADGDQRVGQRKVSEGRAEPQRRMEAQAFHGVRNGQ
jgi:hypothetical protein